MFSHLPSGRAASGAGLVPVRRSQYRPSVWWVNGTKTSRSLQLGTDYLLGNIADPPMIDLVTSEQQVAFGQAKRDTLPEFCRNCEVRFACHGGCPKNRFVRTPDGEDGLNYLCPSYELFFNHIDHPMRLMSQLLHEGRAPSEVSALLAAERAARYADVGCNDPCPCGSGRKYKRCHGVGVSPLSTHPGPVAGDS